MRDVDLGWQRVFVEVARSGTLSEAARRLNLTQTAVSYQIRRAEDQFGTPLLHRLPRGVIPTETRARLLQILSDSVAQIDQLAAHTRKARAPTVLRLHTDFALSALWLIPRIHGFRASHPEYDLQIIASQHTDLAQLQDGDLAAVFGTAAALPPDTPLLLPERVVAVCAPGLAGASLARGDLIHLDSTATAPWFDWPGYLAAIGVARDMGGDGVSGGGGHLRCNTYSLVIEAALAGQGIALGWRGLVDPLLAEGRLIEAGPQIAAPDRGYFLTGAPAGGPGQDRLKAWLMAQRAPSGPPV
ncbi:LysR family transcriptional regulator [Paracoccus hibiscisoli]|uniref:LysR family transcriptional regulator n=1 Tax=Paracoccus hibiscisoli TaxID=2023261 RepID=A0A4U0QRC5_9RHOB|nr:LysR family transcriptional regulator [Paracoccus hibiscisoli]TJZ84543.1 LysR family transcriptional regulator [Paracoccus hibiscisoli]